MNVADCGCRGEVSCEQCDVRLIEKQKEIEELKKRILRLEERIAELSKQGT